MAFAHIPGTIEADAFRESEEGDFLGKASAVVATWDIRSENSDLENNLTSLLYLHRNVRRADNQNVSLCSHWQTTRASSRRRSSFCVSPAHLSQATGFLLLSCAPTQPLELDKTTASLTATRNSHRSCGKNPNCSQKTHSYANSSSSFGGKSNDQRAVLATWSICSRMMREKYELRAHDC